MPSSPPISRDHPLHEPRRRNPYRLAPARGGRPSAGRGLRDHRREISREPMPDDPVDTGRAPGKGTAPGHAHAARSPATGGNSPWKTAPPRSATPRAISPASCWSSAMLPNAAGPKVRSDRASCSSPASSDLPWTPSSRSIPTSTSCCSTPPPRKCSDGRPPKPWVNPWIDPPARTVPRRPSSSISGSSARPTSPAAPWETSALSSAHGQAAKISRSRRRSPRSMSSGKSS